MTTEPIAYLLEEYNIETELGFRIRIGPKIPFIVNMTPGAGIVEERIQEQGWGYICRNCGRKWMYSLALLGNEDHKIKWNEDQPEPPCGFAEYYELEK